MKHPCRVTTAALALAFVAAAAFSPSAASVFVKVDVPTLKKMSESVVHARVVDMSSAWNADHTYIFTEVKLEVKGRLHGRSDDLITIRVPGGTVDDFVAEMIGAPKFVVDDEVVAFVGRWRDGAAMVAGYEQGLSSVHRDEAGNLVLRGGAADGMPISVLARTLGRSDR